MQIVVLCGGLATRLGALTADTPKSLVPVAGRPFIDWQLPLFARQGFTDVLCLVGHLGTQISDHVGNGARYGLHVTYCPDGAEPLGTDGALLHALPQMEERFAITYGDSYLPAITPALVRQLWTNGLRSVITEWEGVDYGFKITDRAFLPELLIGRHIERVPMPERFHEIGSPGGLRRLERHFAHFGARYVNETTRVLHGLDLAAVDRLAHALAQVRDQCGRLFIVGLGGSAAHASHAVNDFRKIGRMECYAPTDNVAELTARINDDGWSTGFVGYLTGSRFSGTDALLVLSVGGGTAKVSAPIVAAIDHARSVGAQVFGIVGAAGGHTLRRADVCVQIPSKNTAQVEGICAILWHLLVSHPAVGGC